MQQLTTTRNTAGPWVCVTAVGQIDVVTAPTLRQELVEIVAGGQALVAIDLDGVEFLDSFGLGVLVGALKRCRASGGDLALICSRDPGLRLLALTQLDRIITIVAQAADLPGDLPARGGDRFGH